MILVDANLLVYAFMEGMPDHSRSQLWLETHLHPFGATDERPQETDGRVGLPWGSLLAFVRIASNRRIFKRPATTERCWRQVGRWLDSEVAWIPLATPEHREILGELLRSPGGA